MNSREGVSTSLRYQLRFPASLARDLEDFAGQHGLGLCPAIRLLVGRGLLAEARLFASPEVSEDSHAALAALTAAEHAVLMVASILPEGERRMRSLAESATQAALDRLSLFREPAPASAVVPR